MATVLFPKKAVQRDGLAQSIARLGEAFERADRLTRITKKINRWQVKMQTWNVFNHEVEGPLKPIKIPVEKNGEVMWMTVCHKMLLTYQCHDGSVDNYSITLQIRRAGISMTIHHPKKCELVDALLNTWREVAEKESYCRVEAFRERLSELMLPTIADYVWKQLHKAIVAKRNR